MKRRAVLSGLVIVLIALGASLTTARARQISSENDAHIVLVRQQRDTFRLLDQVRADGVSAQALAQLSAAARHLSATRPPASFPVFGTERALFYQRRTVEFRSLETRVRSTLRASIAQSRADAERELARLSTDITEARSLDASIDAAATAQAALSRALSGAGVPRQIDAVTTTARSTRSALALVVRRQQGLVDAVVTRGRDNRAGVAGVAADAVASVNRQLSLLALFTGRSARYQHSLDGLTAAVSAQPTARQAAVKELRVEARVTQVRADYNRTVPQKFILVSTESQSAALYENGGVIYSTPVTTGGPELPTDHGVFHIYLKASPFEFHSPWPPSSPYYYSPTPVDYWMPFDGGEGLHDASWRSNFGPGSNLAPTDLGSGRTILGTHGCVNLPHDAAALIWNWAPVGTAVVVV